MLLMKKQRTFTTGFSGFVPGNYDQCSLVAPSYALKKKKTLCGKRLSVNHRNGGSSGMITRVEGISDGQLWQISQICA